MAWEWLEEEKRKGQDEETERRAIEWRRKSWHVQGRAEENTQNLSIVSVTAETRNRYPYNVNIIYTLYPVSSKQQIFK
jgi:hypothetical protein